VRKWGPHTGRSSRDTRRQGLEPECISLVRHARRHTMKSGEHSAWLNQSAVVISGVAILEQPYYLSHTQTAPCDELVFLLRLVAHPGLAGKKTPRTRMQSRAGAARTGHHAIHW
jgi:hypothetical protein